MKKLTYLFFLFIASNLFAQQQSTPISTVDMLTKYQQNFPLEKLYLSFDKSYYNAGDTIWFKSFLLNNSPKLSGKIYVELFNDSLKLVERKVVILENGLGFGEFLLNKNLLNGNYTLRAYSNWQQNFGEDYFFQKNLYIGNARTDSWLINSSQQLNLERTNYNLDVKVKLTNLMNDAIGLRDVELYVMNDNRRLMRILLQTKVDGSILTKIPIGEKISGKYTLFIVDRKDINRKVVLPLFLANEDQIDFQFMPEGGYLVNGIYNKVAFKILGKDGLGKNLNGKIINNKNEVITDFTSQHNGMGNFHLLPHKGETYTAVFSLNGKQQQEKLPLAKDEGSTLRITHLSNPDSLLIYVKVSDSKKTDKKYLLIAQNREKIFLKAELNLINGYNTLKLAKNNFPDGIVQFTLFSPEQQPVNERQVLINQKRQMKVDIKGNKDTYYNRDSIALEITATTEDGAPIMGSFSLTVTDDSQVKQQEDEAHIVSYFLLQSNLKGNVENAGWYFKNTTPETLLALDNLLLTQAWVGYNWSQLLAPNQMPRYKFEMSNAIEGSVTNISKKPVPSLKVLLLTMGKNISITDTLSNSEGKFKFNNLPLIDSAEYVIKIRNLKGKSSNALITVNEFQPAKDINNAPLTMPWYVNTDTVALKYYKTSDLQIKQQEMLKGRNILETVEIKGVGDLREQSFFFDTEKIMEINEIDLKKVPRKSLMDLLKESIPGLSISRAYASCHGGIKLHSIDEEDFVINTFPLTSVRVDKISTDLLSDIPFQTNHSLFTYLKAEDVKHIALHKRCGSYLLEITTRSGSGPWIAKSANGIYIYKPLPLSIGKQFYSPKYTPEKNSPTTDLRATIYWNANVVTDKAGKASVSFYAADLPGSYTVKVEGTDLGERFGYGKSNLKILQNIKSK